MFNKLPADFNAEWYRANYPDVAQSGMSAREHYLRFGRRMGRKASGGPASAERTGTASTIEAPDAGLPKSPSSEELSPRPSRPAIIDRPANFDSADVSPLPAPVGEMANSDQGLSLDTIGKGPFASPDEEARLRTPVKAYARMLSLQQAEASDESPAIGLCGAEFFQTGETRIDTAWFPSESRLRLRISGGSGATAASKGWVLRAFQAEPANPDRLKMAGQGIQLPALGPVFHDLDLIHPLMPLLLELSDAEGLTRDIALLPFPSLLPGGMHEVELKALQNEANPMDAFWALSASFLLELVGGPEWKARSISALSLREPGLTAENTCASTAIRDWIRAVFGLPTEPADETAAPESGEAGKRKTRRSAGSSGDPASGGVRLVLPGNALPSISALVSRGIELGAAAHLTGPFLVSEPRQSRPQWSVTLPADRDYGPAIPILRPVEGAVGAKAQPRCPVHLAIVPSPASLLGDLLSPSVTEDGVGEALLDKKQPLTVVLDAADATRTAALVRALRECTGLGELELLVRLPGNDEELRVVLDELCGDEGWTAVSFGADLRELAQGSANEMMLTVSDRISLPGSDVLARLCAMLRSDEAAGSASCTLLGEKIIKKQTVLQPASAGLFPSHVAFAGSPRLAFSEPDAAQALSSVAYPVVANTMLLTVWRRRALANLPRPSGPVPPAFVDIRLGLDLLAAGYRNLCTTEIRAALSGAYVRRDVIDPVGSNYVHPDLWGHLLTQVTLLRELN